jgi:hypothetical protein
VSQVTGERVSGLDTPSARGWRFTVAISFARIVQAQTSALIGAETGFATAT